MTTTDQSVEERVSRLEGAYEHLATKADVADVKVEVAEVKVEVAELKSEIARVEAKIDTRFAELQTIMERRFATQTRWFVGFMLSGMALLTVVVFGAARLIQ